MSTSVLWTIYRLSISCSIMTHARSILNDASVWSTAKMTWWQLSLTLIKGFNENSTHDNCGKSTLDRGPSQHGLIVILQIDRSSLASWLHFRPYHAAKLIDSQSLLHHNTEILARALYQMIFYWKSAWKDITENYCSRKTSQKTTLQLLQEGQSPVCGTYEKDVLTVWASHKPATTRQPVYFCKQLTHNSVHHTARVCALPSGRCKRVELVKEEHTWPRSPCSLKHFSHLWHNSTTHDKSALSKRVSQLEIYLLISMKASGIEASTIKWTSPLAWDDWYIICKVVQWRLTACLGDWDFPSNSAIAMSMKALGTTCSFCSDSR